MRAQYDLICRAFAKLDVQEPMLIRNCVSFKAGGTNMVDIIPLRHQLRCYLVLAQKPIRVILINELGSRSDGEVCAVGTRSSVGRSWASYSLD